MLMASCSKNVEPSPSDPDAWQTDLNLPVPIEFGTSSVATKAGNLINGLENESKLQFGVFAIDNDARDLTNDDEYLLYNVRATSEYGKFGFKPYSYYYPMTSERSFSFYAYYEQPVRLGGEPENSVIIRNKDQIFVNMAIGDEDILYGNSKVTSEMEKEVGSSGFNGRYIRAVRKNIEEDKQKDYYPVIKFKHVTSAIQFYARTSEEKATYFTDNNIRLHEIAIKDLPLNANLCVVDKNNPTNEGLLFVPEEETGGTYSIQQSQKFFPVYDETSKGAGYPFGGVFFLVPTEQKIKGTITLIQRVGTVDQEPKVVDFAFAPSDLKNAAGEALKSFEAGNLYKITLLIHSPEEITFEVSVDTWKDAYTGGEYHPDSSGGFTYEIG